MRALRAELGSLLVLAPGTSHAASSESGRRTCAESSLPSSHGSRRGALHAAANAGPLEESNQGANRFSRTWWKSMSSSVRCGSWPSLEEMFLNLADGGPRERIPELNQFGD